VLSPALPGASGRTRALCNQRLAFRSCVVPSAIPCRAMNRTTRVDRMVAEPPRMMFHATTTRTSSAAHGFSAMPLP
jgi:hypothetical protein